MIKLTKVESSQIYAIGHDGASTLAIQFKNKDGSPGSIYHYKNFSHSHFIAFSEAKSIGSYFYAHIKHCPHQYPYTKIS
jgi:hypothetical protein